MSTEYYLPQYPITGLELAECADYNMLTIWVQDGQAGVLNLPKAVTGTFLRVLTHDDVGMGVMHTWGSRDEGIMVTDPAHLPDDTIVISGSGDLLTAGQVRALAGKGAAVSDGNLVLHT